MQVDRWTAKTKLRDKHHKMSGYIFRLTLLKKKQKANINIGK